jgi:hypothetical protein
LFSVDPETSLLELLLSRRGNLQEPEWVLGEEWIMFVEGDEGTLSFLRLAEGCKVPTEIVGIYKMDLAPDGRLLAFEDLGVVYILDLKVLLGPNYERLRCDR